MTDFSTKTNDEIDNWIKNHERQRETDSPLYRELIEERSRRHGKGLRLDVSIDFLRQVARDKRFVGYGELAEANGVEWSQARYRMNGNHGHLEDILAYCNSHGLPLLTAIVVNKENLQTGAMEESTLKGFVDGCRWLGLSVTDGEKFLRQCQQECFEWGSSKVRVLNPEAKEQGGANDS